MNCIRSIVFTLLVQLATVGSSCGGESNVSNPRTNPAPSAERGRSAQVAAWPRQMLRAERTWQLNLPGGERFDASGLLLTKTGQLLTINDRGPLVYRIDFLDNTNAANLVPLPDCFTPAQLRPWAAQKLDRYDSEGLAQDDQGRIYICEEANRWILRCAGDKGIERLAIDWSPVSKYFDLSDPNASFEGIAIGNGRLYVANERQMGRIIVVDLNTLKILDDFSVHSSVSRARDVHYSDLSWFDGVLYALLRESRCVLAIDPGDHRVLSEYDFRAMEREPDVLYRSMFPTSQMEGLAVDRESIWLVTDNNGTVRARHPNDIRPTLFKARRNPLPRERSPKSD